MSLKHLSDRAKRAKVEPHIRLARELNGLSHPTCERLIKLSKLCADHEIKAAWKSRGEGRRSGKNETTSPGTPTVAGFLMLLDSDIERMYNRRMKYDQRFNDDLDAMIAKAEHRLMNYEDPELTAEKRTLAGTS